MNIDTILDEIILLNNWNNEIIPIKHKDPFLSRVRDKCVNRNNEEIKSKEQKITDFYKKENLWKQK